MDKYTELNLIDVDVDYNDNDSIVRGFLTYSALNRMNEFDFEAAFSTLRVPIENKLHEHAQCTYEEYRQYNEEYFFDDVSSFEPFTTETDYLYISVDDVKDAIFKMRYEKSKDAFDGMFSHLEEMVDSIEGLNEDETEKNVILFDEVIHAQHETGAIFDDVDVEDIKQDLDAELLVLMGIEV